MLMDLFKNMLKKYKMPQQNQHQLDELLFGPAVAKTWPGAVRNAKGGTARFGWDETVVAFQSLKFTWKCIIWAAWLILSVDKLTL